MSSRVIFGAAAFSRMSQDDADQVVGLLDEYNLNHLDVAASYGDAELRLAPLLSTRRDDFFLATKTGERSGPAARAELESSLERLGVSHVDLIQLHNLVEPDEWEEAHAPGGALAALVQARDEGLTRFIGVTGHGTRIPGMHLRSLFPYNFSLLANPAYRADVEALLDLCAERDVAVQTIKSVARRRWTDESGGHQSWYEPLRNPTAIEHAVAWVLGRPQLFLNSSSDSSVLRTILDAALVESPVSPSEADMAADVAGEGIEPLFDGTELERI
jgi:aryl-alcohol dehydrogenase-like predicted oxidoreductase